MPVGPYGSFEECVADNQDKDDPEAFCGWLKSQGSASFGRYDDIDFSPPQGAREEASRGLEWRREHGRGGTEVGIARARDISNGSNLSPETLRRMKAYFDRSQSDKQAQGWSPGEDGYPSNGRIAWALWGGDPGYAWARKVVGQMEARDNSASTFQAVPGGGELPEAYRPALAEDVPEGRACGNCVFYDESRISEDGTEAWCSFWDAQVRGDHYCDAWADEAPAEDAPEQAADEEEMSMGRASFETVGPDEVLEVGDVEMGLRWEGVLTIEEELTGDGRMFTANAVRWEQLPVPLRWVKLDVGEHMNAIVVGRIDEVYREGNRIMGRGIFDMGSEEGREAARQVKENLTPGVSVDLDEVSFEIRVRAEAEIQEPQEDLEGRQTVMRYGPDDEVMITSDARLRAATIVATPAFADARIYLVDEMPQEDQEEMKVLKQDPEEEGSYEELLASVSQISRPSVEDFRDPKLSGPTPLTVEDDGRVYGHLAVWGTCHVGFPGECVEAPSSASNYAYFRTGAVRTIEGMEVGVGRITLDTTHAGRRLGATDTAAHYEHTGIAVADVAAGEDAYGIWIAGVLRPGVSDDQVRILQASPLSGDWRRIGGQLELVAALAVNSPGFPIPRALVAGGSVQSLQSSGIVARASIQPKDLKGDDDVLLKRLLERERKALAEQKAAALTAKRRVLIAAASSRASRALRGR